MEKVQRNSIKKNGHKYSKNDKSSTLPRKHIMQLQGSNGISSKVEIGRQKQVYY